MIVELDYIEILSSSHCEDGPLKIELWHNAQFEKHLVPFKYKFDQLDNKDTRINVFVPIDIVTDYHIIEVKWNNTVYTLFTNDDIGYNHVRHGNTRNFLKCLSVIRDKNNAITIYFIKYQ